MNPFYFELNDIELNFIDEIYFNINTSIYEWIE